VSLPPHTLRFREQATLNDKSWGCIPAERQASLNGNIAQVKTNQFWRIAKTDRRINHFSNATFCKRKKNVCPFLSRRFFAFY
jgi:hypothetical protein